MSVAYDYSPMSIDTPFGEGWGCLTQGLTQLPIPRLVC